MFHETLADTMHRNWSLAFRLDVDRNAALAGNRKQETAGQDHGIAVRML